MKIQKHIDVRLERKAHVSSLRAVQYDTGIQLVFHVLDFDFLSGTTATLYVRKKSGKFVYQETGISVDENEVIVDLENQALTEYGETPYQLRFLNGTDVISTFSSSMFVERSLADADAVESKTVIAAFEAKTAEQIAQIEAAAQDQIAQIQNQFNTFAAKNETANGIKGYLSGAVVFADDVSPVEHNPVVTIHGKNLFNYNAWRGIDIQNGNAVFSDDGAVTLTATADDCFTNYGWFPEAAKIKVKPGEVLTLSWEVDGENGSVYIFPNGSADSFAMAWSAQRSLKYTVPTGCEFITFRLGVANSGNTIKYWNIQIEKGDTATEYVPYIDPSTATVKRCGKNLVAGYTTKTVNGITFTVNSDGSISVKGTATGDAVLNSRFRLAAGTYTVSGDIANSVALDGDMYVWSSVDSGIVARSYTGATNRTFTLPAETYVDVYLRIKDGRTCNGETFYPQIEVGKSVTDFETPKAAETHIPTADGTVSGMTSLAPNMTILTDTDGVVVECEYIRDTNKVIEKLTNAITALGGTV